MRKTARPSTSTLQIQSDRLGTLVSSLCESFTASSSWQDFVDTFRGRSYLSPDVSSVDHPAAPLLDKWRLEGVPVLSSAEPWSLEELDARLERGCHPSACEHASFLREEFAEFIERSFWAVLPYRLVRTLPNLQLSPAAVKDERDRKPRLLCDHSWYPVNDTTLTHAPLEAMQFGGALPRVLRAVRHANPRYGPTRLAKHDIKDGFYRMFLRARDCLRLGIVLPRYADEEPLVAIPMSCTMGWTMSPPTFSVMSETVTDLANAKFAASPRQAIPHRLSSIAEEGDELHQDFRPVDREPDDLKATNSLRRVVGLPELRKPPRESDAVPISNNAHTRPLGLTDVFVDDFIQIGQGGRDRMAALRDHLLHAVDEVLSQPTPDEKHRAEAISLKKLLQGDGSWSTRKLILGWILDTVRQTIELPPHRKETLAKIFEDLKTRRRVSKKTWSSILGKLRFVAIAIPGSAGLFSALQLALNRAEHNRIKVTRHLKRHIHAFAALAADVCSRPTYLPELVAERPAVIGATDAARQGMGGVFFDHEERPFVWRYCFTPHVQSKLITFRHRDGSITNSDLEQAGVIAQLGLISDTLPVRYATIDILTDNTPAVSRFRKGSVSSDSPASYLCREASLQQRAERYHARVYHIPGTVNAMADDASRLQHLSDSAFLAHFSQTYPQTKPWKLLQLPRERSSRLISALLCSSSVQPRPVRPPPTGNASLRSGKPSVLPYTSPAPFGKWTAPRPNCVTFSSSPNGTEATAVAANPSELAVYSKPYWQWARGSPTWVNRIPAETLASRDEIIPYSLLSSRSSRMTTTLRNEPTLSPSTCSDNSPKSWTRATPRKAASTSMRLTSASWPSTGLCAPGSIPVSPAATKTPPAARARKPFVSKMSPSPSRAANGPPPRSL